MLEPGAEVLLVFVNGDPDLPLIAGAVYNGANPAPLTSANNDPQI
jgi:type VI secretion system secreted protein VgrG